MTGIFTKLLDTVTITKKTKFSFDASIQNIEPTWHLQGKRKSHKTDEERKELEKDTGFSIIGDPVGEVSENTGYFLCECKSCGWRKNLEKGYLAKKVVNCHMCLNIRLEEEANARGLEFNGFSSDGDMQRRNYTFIGCGHSRDIAAGDVRNGDFSCTECYSEKLDKAFEICGLENLGRPTKEEYPDLDTTQFYKVKFKECGHTLNALQHLILNNGVGQCKICYEQTLKNKYEPLHNISILEVVPGAKRKIKLNSCGHEKVVNLSNLKSGSFQCSICQIEKFKREAELVGLKYIGVSEERRKTGDPLHIYEAPCGHNVLSVTSHIRTGHWTCRTCNAGYLDNPNKLYLFKISSNGFTFLKLGYSKSPEYRKYDYKMTEGTITELLKVVEVPTGRDAIKYENELHEKYSDFNYDKSVMKNYLQESGFTECYPITLLDSLIEDLTILSNSLRQKGVNEQE